MLKYSGGYTESVSQINKNQSIKSEDFHQLQQDINALSEWAKK